MKPSEKNSPPDQSKIHDSKVYTEIGLTQLQNKEYEEAKKSFSKAVELKPDNADFHLNKGKAHGVAFQLRHAIKEFNKAIEINPEIMSAFYNRGRAFQGLKKYKEALRDYDKAIELDPEFADLFINRGTTYHYLGDLEKRNKDYISAANLGDKEIQSWLTDKGIEW